MNMQSVFFHAGGFKFPHYSYEGWILNQNASQLSVMSQIMFVGPSVQKQFFNQQGGN